LKKRILLVCLAVVLLFSGCTFSFELGTPIPAEPNVLEPLTFMTPRSSVEDGVTPETDEGMAYLKQWIEVEDPYMGRLNTFALYELTDIEYSIPGTIWFIAINRLGYAVQDVSFDITLRMGNTYLLQGTSAVLSEETFGIIPNHTAVPVVFSLSGAAGEYLEANRAPFTYMAMENLSYTRVG